jgi:nicotinate-nucleotide--dimethylbenzimidazole phosphoribosyltransferase
VADEASYLSRFTLKFAEIMAAGIATAVSGYLIAHLGGFLSTTAPAPTPAAVEVAPRVVAVPKAETVSPPAAADAGALRATPAHEAAPQAAAPARTTANAAAAPARKRDTSAAEARPREKEAVEAKPRDKEAAEAKPRDKEAAEAKPREKEAAESKARDKDDKESVEARVRAALANVDASKPAPAEAPAPPRQAAIPPAPAAATAQPLPAEAPLTTGAIAPAPRAAEASPQPAPQAPAEPNPLVSVEIKSRPVAEVPPAAAAQDGAQQASAQEDAKEDKGFLATIKKIPSLLRPASGATTSEPPRPPLPVGEQ